MALRHTSAGVAGVNHCPRIGDGRVGAGRTDDGARLMSAKYLALRGLLAFDGDIHGQTCNKGFSP
jgi:hypothetical protein